MNKIYVWDPFVRVFHWSVAAGFAANALLTDAEGAVHERIGYAILGLVALRVFWGIVGSPRAKFRDFPPSLTASVGQLQEMATGRRHAHVGHSPLGALMIYNLLATLAAICVTGWMMTTDRWFGIAWVEDMHKLLVTWAEVSVVLHIAAVLVESWRLHVNLAGAMLTGSKTLPSPEELPD